MNFWLLIKLPNFVGGKKNKELKNEVNYSYIITLFVLSQNLISIQLHWYASNVNFFSLGKYMNESSEIILCFVINLNEI